MHLEGTADKLFPSFVQFLTAKGDDEKEKEETLVSQLQELEDFLSKSGPFLGGQEMKAYDAMVVRTLPQCMPWHACVRMAVADNKHLQRLCLAFEVSLVVAMLPRAQHAGTARIVQFPRLYHLTTALDHFKGWKMPGKLGNVTEYIDRVKQTDAFTNTDYGQEMILKGWAPKVEG